METKPTKSERKRQLLTSLAKLVELYPACFAADTSRLHRPLKIGIHRDLIKRGVQPSEVQALKLYTERASYKAALIAGGPRYDLDGNPHGEVTAEEIAAAKVALAETQVRAAQERRKRIEHHKTNVEEGREKSAATDMADSEHHAKSTGRLSLSDLKAAAQARKTAQRAA